MTTFAFNDLDSTKRLDALESFIEHWVGPRQPEYGASSAALDHLQLPTPLRRLYAFCFNWPREGALRNGIPLLSCQNRMLRLETTNEPQQEVPPTLLCFAISHQGVTQWATLFEGDDPPVYGLDYDNGDRYVSPDGVEHKRWGRITDSLTDFLISYVVYDFHCASPIWPLTPLVEKLQSAPEQMTLLAPTVLGYPGQILLYDDNVLVMKTPKWKEPDHWAFAVRNGAALAKLDRFAGRVTRAQFEIAEVEENETRARIWRFSVKQDGSGSFSSAQSTQHFLSRDKIPAGGVSIEAVAAEIEAHAVTEQSADFPVTVTVFPEEARRLEGLMPSRIMYLPRTTGGKLIQMVANAIDDPSLALLRQLELGSPLDWVD